MSTINEIIMAKFEGAKQGAAADSGAMYAFRDVQLSRALAAELARNAAKNSRGGVGYMSIHRFIPVGGLATMIASAVPAYRYANLSFVDSWVSIWAVFFLIGFTLTALEASFFLKASPIQGWRPFLMAFVITGIMAAVAAAFSATSARSQGLVFGVQSRLVQHSLVYWLWRFFGAAGLFTFLYGTIGSATWPFIKKYYSDRSLGLDLHVPDGRTVILLQMIRGFVVAIVLFPLIITLRASKTIAVAVLAVLLLTTMAIGPLTMASRWPIALRMIHVAEFALFTVLYSAVAHTLFAPEI